MSDDRFDDIDAAFLAEWEHQREEAGDAPDEDNDELWTARAELELVRDFARARRVSPLAVLGVVLARVIAHTPPDVVLPDLVGDQASLNLFVALVGRSGQGKGGAEAAGMALLDMPEPLSPQGIGSGEGLPHLFVTGSYVTETNEETKKSFRRWVVRHHATAALVSVPEVDTLGALTSRSGSTLAPELRKAYMGEQLGFQYASAEKRLPVARHAYRLALVVGVQPARAEVLLNDVDGGTPQRYLWLPTSDPNAPDIRPDDPRETFPWKTPQPTNDPHCRYRRGHWEIPVCDTARQLVDANRLASLRGTVEALDAHALLTRLKVAAALGLLSNHLGVNEQDWRLSGLLMRISDGVRATIRRHLDEKLRSSNAAAGRLEAERAAVMSDALAKQEIAKVRAAVLTALARHKDGAPRAVLTRCVTPRLRGHLDQVLESLVAEEVIDEYRTNADGPGRKGAMYRRR